ncbi:Uncharacterized protein APZ42_012597 [Daphnia magna]|uniref:Uncharacterized protein n=1 Tax=Daphnia magna TaxID=35525 RepID=A0A162RP83_9CRUS|nr:Uncharacterized protein APZ42_012597 [Daphnia magna]
MLFVAYGLVLQSSEFLLNFSDKMEALTTTRNHTNAIIYCEYLAKVAITFFPGLAQNPNEKNFSACKLCHKYFAGDKTFFTNFKVHCTLVHKDEWDSFSLSATPLESKPNGSSMVNFVYPTRPVSKVRKDLLDRRVTRLICEENLPLHIVNRPGFRGFMPLAVPGYQLPAAKRNMNGYIGFTCQAVTTDFELFNCFLVVKEMRSRHTTDAIAVEYEDILQKWDRPFTKVHKLMTDGDSNMIVAHFNGFPGWEEDEAQHFDEELPEIEARLVQSLQPVAESTGDMERVELELDLEDPYGVLDLDLPLSDEDILEVVGDGEDDSEIQDIETSLEDTYLFQAPTWTIHVDEQHYVLTSSLRSTCVAHTLQLVIKDALSTLKGVVLTAISRASKIVNYVRHSVIDTKTLVNSLRTLIEAFKKNPTLQGKFNATKKYGKLPVTELKTLKELVTVLETFKEATDEFQEDYETVGVVTSAYIDMLTQVSLTTP